MTGAPSRPGELALPAPPASTDAGLAFIGTLRTPWQRGDCPKNLREARARDGTAAGLILPAYRPALTGLAAGQPVILLYWMAAARRDLLIQHPRHSDTARGTFALRSPARPNPIALAVVTLTALDIATGHLTFDALDCFDGTPLLDIKPWLASVDIPPGPPA